MVIHHRRCAPHSRRQLNFCKSFVGCNPRRASKHTNFYNCGNTIISFSQRFRDPNALLSLERRRRNSAMVIPFVVRGMAFANGQGIVACLPFPQKRAEVPFPFPFPQNSLGGGSQARHDVTKKKRLRVVRSRMEEDTARKKQAQAWGAALLVSAQNMDILCQYLLWGLLLHSRASFCRLSRNRTSVAHEPRVHETQAPVLRSSSE